MTPKEKILVGAYATLVMGKVKTMEEVPESLRAWVEIEIAQRTVEILG